MYDKLIIVESPAKANTIKKFLGGNVKVIASMGHLRDLPKSKLGVNVDKDFEPEYINIRGKGSLIKQIKKDAKNSKKVYLATDPDREGEAISWHLAHILGIPLDSVCRVTFNEITKECVKNSMKNPRTIDMNLTDAQQARRVIDRVVGYKISPVLWKKVRRGLSAGRVQSVAVKMIVDREEEIEKFIPKEYWNLSSILYKDALKNSFEAKLYGTKDEKLEIGSKEEADKIIRTLNNSKYIVDSVKEGTKKRNPSAPFTTSTMQQDASNKINFAIKKTMSVAQTLYEGVKISKKGNVGLITYMRTDSTRISDEARASAKKFIIKNYGQEYYGGNIYKSKNSSQDAHEAIRPTYIELTPDSIKKDLSNDQYKLYKLIYNRFLASQMSEAIYNTKSAEIMCDKYLLKANGQSIQFKGYLKVYDNQDKTEASIILPDIKDKDILKLDSVNSKQSFTQPPARYTEASLVKALEEKGIGRPSTYSPTISTIIQRRYIEKQAKQLMPTELGKVVNKLLIERFPDIINEEFTAKIESEFDEVEAGTKKWKNIIKDFYGPFKKQVEKVDKELEHIELEAEESDEICEKCGRKMVYKYGRYGRFLACPGYPECKNVKSIIETIKEVCPKCGGKVIVKTTKKRRRFYVCENNPDKCDYISWNKPENK